MELKAPLGLGAFFVILFRFLFGGLILRHASTTAAANASLSGRRRPVLTVTASKLTHLLGLLMGNSGCGSRSIAMPTVAKSGALFFCSSDFVQFIQ